MSKEYVITEAELLTFEKLLADILDMDHWLKHTDAYLDAKESALRIREGGTVN